MCFTPFQRTCWETRAQARPASPHPKNCLAPGNSNTRLTHTSATLWEVAWPSLGWG